MLPSLLPGTHMPAPNLPIAEEINYFKQLNKTMTDDLLETAAPWA